MLWRPCVQRLQHRARLALRREPRRARRSGGEHSERREGRGIVIVGVVCEDRTLRLGPGGAARRPGLQTGVVEAGGGGEIGPLPLRTRIELFGARDGGETVLALGGGLDAGPERVEVTHRDPPLRHRAGGVGLGGGFEAGFGHAVHHVV